jgi:hypothetical protein
MRLVVMAVLFVLAAAACSIPGTNAQATPSGSPSPSKLAQATGPLDAQVTMPPGFPTDVPIYTGARLTAGAGFTGTGVMTWGMEWETLDSVQKVRSFYASKFSQGDWTISFTSSTSTGFTANVARKSDSHYTGTLGADGSSGVTKISLSLVAPA